MRRLGFDLAISSNTWHIARRVARHETCPCVFNFNRRKSTICGWRKPPGPARLFAEERQQISLVANHFPDAVFFAQDEAGAQHNRRRLAIGADILTAFVIFDDRDLPSFDNMNVRRLDPAA